jgi:alginate O-acetyltransferase complex protein AlgI
MLFSAPEFIFLFAPLAVALHFALARWSIEAALLGTTCTSLIFYGWWNPPFVVLPLLSIFGNFLLAKAMVASDAATSRTLMWTGIATNLLVLFHYKYTDFALSVFHGTTAPPPSVPLALSFTTFVQIAFLVHVHQRRTPVDLNRYAFFVIFFPHLIAGPIVRWPSFGRQLYERERYRLDWDNIALGITIFVLGLAKKILIADSLSPHVASVFTAAAQGEPVTTMAAWGAAFAFIAQIYFDFSGYSDMAVGLGLLFNLKLPINFAAPLRATNMFDLWRRWHITLSRLARDLIYVPLNRADQGTLWRSAALVLTMAVIGIWHGAGWTFLVWGVFNGVLLLINQAWRALFGLPRGTRAGAIVGWALTFTGFTVGGVFFRASDMTSAWHLLEAMAGFADVPAAAHVNLAWDYWVLKKGILSEVTLVNWFGVNWSLTGSLWTLAAVAIALAVPDTMELANYREGDAQTRWRRDVILLSWRPSFGWMIVTAIAFFACFALIGRVSEFLYYQF